MVADGCAFLLAAALLGLAPGDPDQGGGGAARLQELYAQTRFGEALDETARLSDPVLAAEWRTYLFLAGGDYPAALRAAREGLRSSPGHRGLLSNAVHAALTLGLAEEAMRLVEALEGALDEAGAAAGGEERERVQRLREAARAQRRLELEGRASLLRARVVVVATLALVLGAMLALALQPRQGLRLRTGRAPPSRSPDR